MADTEAAVVDTPADEAPPASEKAQPKARPARRQQSAFMKNAIAQLEAAASGEVSKISDEGDNDDEADETESESESRSRSARQSKSSANEEAGEGEDDATEERELEADDGKPALTLEDLISRAGVDHDTFLGMIEVDIGGEKVGVKEMRDGYLRGKDYTQKSQFLARAHDEVIPYRDVVARLKVDESFQEYIAKFFQGAASAISDAPNYDEIMELTQTDPDKARDALGRYKRKEMELAHWKNQKTQSQREIAAWKERQHAIARQKHTDYDVARTAIVDYLNAKGVSKAELDENPFFEDARVIDMLVDAVQGKFNGKEGGKKAADDLKVSLGRKRESPQPQKLSSGTSGHRVTEDKVHQRKVSTLREKAHKGDKGGWGAYLGEKFRM